MTCAAARPRWRSTSKSPGLAGLAVAIDKRAFLAGSGPRHAPARRRDRGSRGRDAGEGGRAASQRVALRPVPPSGAAAL